MKISSIFNQSRLKGFRAVKLTSSFFFFYFSFIFNLFLFYATIDSGLLIFYFIFYSLTAFAHILTSVYSRFPLASPIYRPTGIFGSL